jgi:hypothetical protein
MTATEKTPTENKVLVAKIFEARLRRDPEPFFTAMADDFASINASASGPTRNRFAHPGLVSCEQLAPLLQGGAALLHQARVLAHLSDGHSGGAQSLHEIEPANMMFRVDPATVMIPHDPWNQSLGLVAADRMNAPARSPCDLSDVEIVWHSSLRAIAREGGGCFARPSE